MIMTLKANQICDDFGLVNLSSFSSSLVGKLLELIHSSKKEMSHFLFGRYAISI